MLSFYSFGIGIDNIQAPSVYDVMYRVIYSLEHAAKIWISLRISSISSSAYHSSFHFGDLTIIRHDHGGHDRITASRLMIFIATVSLVLVSTLHQSHQRYHARKH
jgi:hypothetical protein